MKDNKLNDPFGYSPCPRKLNVFLPNHFDKEKSVFIPWSIHIWWNFPWNSRLPVLQGKKIMKHRTEYYHLFQKFSNLKPQAFLITFLYIWLHFCTSECTIVTVTFYFVHTKSSYLTKCVFLTSVLLNVLLQDPCR